MTHPSIEEHLAEFEDDWEHQLYNESVEEFGKIYNRQKILSMQSPGYLVVLGL